MNRDTPHRPRPIGRRLIVVALCAALGACFGPTPKEVFYVLDDGGALVASSTAPESRPGASDPAVLGVVVTAVNIPALVDRPQIVTRDSTNRAVVSEQNLWAEPVRAAIARTLAARVSSAFADAGRPAQVVASPQSSVVEPTLRVTVDVVRFDAVPNGEAVVEALYTVRRLSDNALRSGRTSASVPIDGTGYEAIVHSWNDALANVDGAIAKLAIEMATPPPAAPAASPTTSPARPAPARGRSRDRGTVDTVPTSR